LITEHPVDTGRLTGVVSATSFEGWSDAVRADFAVNARNANVGSTLLSMDRRVRFWSIDLEPGERLGAHRHTLDYFWTALRAGHGLQHLADGSTRLVTYAAGETHHFDFAPGEFLLHDLENVGDTPLAFVTVEFRGADSGRPGSAHPTTEGDLS
jgi:hypothetical protein